MEFESITADQTCVLIDTTMGLRLEPGRLTLPFATSRTARADVDH